MAFTITPGVRIIDDPSLQYIVPAYGAEGHPYWETRINKTTTEMQPDKSNPFVKVIYGIGQNLGLAIDNFNRALMELCSSSTLEVELLSDLNIKIVGEHQFAQTYLFQQVKVSAK